LIFLIACEKIINIEAFCFQKINLKNIFSQTVPVLMFVKYVFNKQIWRNDINRASFIIDDPLLKPSYGFLDYFKLQKLMEQHNFAINIAFIPWNYKRSNRAVAKLFNGENECFSISVHGCDHTDKEFEIDNLHELNGKITLAKNRMKKHYLSYGTQYDLIMVFPQGKFSPEAMKMLKHNHFLSAVNTGIVPSKKPLPIIKIHELFNPAILAYSGFPLFTRRYPSEPIENFAFDIFLGKPCLIVEHHDYFKDGYSELIKFIKQIQNLDNNIEWSGLGNIIRKAYLQRYLSKNVTAVKLFASECDLENITNTRKKFCVTKHECDLKSIDKVIVDGQTCHFNIIDCELQFSVDLDAGQKKHVKIKYVSRYDVEPSQKPGVKYFSKLRLEGFCQSFAIIY
jgi:hypothetical protein